MLMNNQSKKLCYYQIRGRSVMYGLSCGFLLVFILFAVFYDYNLQNGKEIITERNLMLLTGSFIPFFSCFMILPFAEEVMRTDFEEMIFPYYHKIAFLFSIQNIVYYVLLLIPVFILGMCYASLFMIWYQIYFLCIYLQLFTFAGYFITRSKFATCGIILFYFSATIIIVMSNELDSMLSEAEISFGYLLGFGEDRVSFFKEQGWKMVIAVLSVVFSVVNRRRFSLGRLRDVYD